MFARDVGDWITDGRARHERILYIHPVGMLDFIVGAFGLQHDGIANAKRGAARECQGRAIRGRKGRHSLAALP